ncbi:MAG TPA: glycosyltransferase family 39 protein [bacterium]|nr:glycosyltransferase family 39 protein [bacterium]
MTETRPTMHERKAKLLSALLVVLLAAAAALFFYATNFRALHNPDAMKYAQMSRDILRGEGCAMEEIHPRSFAFVTDGGDLRRENLAVPMRYCLSQSVVAGAFAVFGEKDSVAALTTTALYLLSVLIFYVLAGRLLNPAEAALAAALFALNGQVLTYAVSGLTESLFLLLALAALWWLLRAETSPWNALGAGLALAALWFTKDLAKVFVALAVLGAPWLLAKRRLLTTALLLVGLAAGYVALDRLEGRINHEAWRRQAANIQYDQELIAAHAPRENSWATRLIGKFGGGVILQYSALFPGHTLERSLTPVNEARVFEDNQEVFIAKWKTNAAVTARSFFTAAFNPLMFLFFALFPWLRRDDETQQRRLHWWTIAALAAFLFVCLFLFSMTRYLLALTPLVALFAAATAGRLTEKMFGGHARRRLTATIVLAVLMLYPYALTAGSDALTHITDREARQVRRIDAAGVQALGRFIREQTQRADVLVSDVPWLSLWQGDRTSVWLPVDMEQLTVLRRRVHVDWLLLTFQYPWNMQPWREWLADFVKSGEPVRDGFRFATAYRQGSTIFYLFRAEEEAVQSAMP